MSKQRWEQFCPNCESLMMGEDECWRCKVPTIEVVPAAEVERLREQLDGLTKTNEANVREGVRLQQAGGGAVLLAHDLAQEVEREKAKGNELAEVMRGLADELEAWTLGGNQQTIRELADKARIAEQTYRK